MASSDERREVARKLRDCIFYAKGHDLNGDCDMWSDKCVETRCTLYNDIAACIEEGGNVNLSAEEVFDRLADLIDPICQMVVKNHHACCGRCGHRLADECEVEEGYWEFRPYCPDCGARITDGGERS